MIDHLEQPDREVFIHRRTAIMISTPRAVLVQDLEVAGEGVDTDIHMNMILVILFETKRPHDNLP